MEYKKVCIDSDYLIDILRKQPEVLKYFRALENESTLLATTVVNSFELYYGAYKIQKQNQIQLVTELLHKLIVFEWKAEFSQLMGEILADLERKGQIIDFRDVFIGVIVLKNDFSLLTRNLKHFERIPNLKLTPF